MINDFLIVVTTEVMVTHDRLSNHKHTLKEVNTWCDVLRNNVISIFLANNLTGKANLELLENIIEPAITDKIENF